MKTPKTFLYEQQAGIGTITLNRPERLNAITFEVYRELTDFFADLRDEKDVRVVVITGAGRAFCSGGDVESIIGRLFERDAEGLLEFTRATCALISAMRNCKRPIVAAINGVAAGAGAVIAAAADVRIACETAKIAYLFTRVGLSGADMGAAWLLPRLIGFGRASELLMTGDFIDAAEARRIGLYNRVVPSDKLMEEALGFAKKLATGPQLGLEMTKALLNREATMDLSSALDLEAEAQATCMQHPDFREAYQAFREKRAPSFR